MTKLSREDYDSPYYDALCRTTSFRAVAYRQSQTKITSKVLPIVVQEVGPQKLLHKKKRRNRPIELTVTQPIIQSQRMLGGAYHNSVWLHAEKTQNPLCRVFLI